MEETLRDRKRRERRNAILDTFGEELASREVDAVSIDEVARIVDVSRATIFNYFKTKQDIVFALAHREVDALDALIVEWSGNGISPMKTILEATYRLVAVSFSDPQVTWRVISTVLGAPEATDSPIRRMARMLESLVELGKEAGEFDDRIDAGGCARSILGTFFAELYFITSQGGSSSGISRHDFDVVANRLAMQWSRTDA